MMKALSIQQPWAWAIITLGKDVENRIWRTNFRGTFLIHTGKKLDLEGVKALREMGFEVPDNFPLGGIVGHALLMDCVPVGVFSPNQWAFGPWCYLLDHASPTEFVPLRGQLAFFEVPNKSLPMVFKKRGPE